jgi:hypothetical protein
MMYLNETPTRNVSFDAPIVKIGGGRGVVPRKKNRKKFDCVFHPYSLSEPHWSIFTSFGMIGVLADFFVPLSEVAILVYSQNILCLSDQAMRCTLCA